MHMHDSDIVSEKTNFSIVIIEHLGHLLRFLLNEKFKNC